MSFLLLFAVAVFQAAPSDSAVLVLSNRPVMVFKAPLGALTTRERAEAANARILRALEDAPDSLGVRVLPEGLLLTLGKYPLFTITPADVDTARGITLEENAGTVLNRLRVGIAEEREARNLARLLVALALSLAATALVGSVPSRRRWSRVWASWPPTPMWPTFSRGSPRPGNGVRCLANIC